MAGEVRRAEAYENVDYEYEVNGASEKTIFRRTMGKLQGNNKAPAQESYSDYQVPNHFYWVIVHPQKLFSALAVFFAAKTTVAGAGKDDGFK